MNKFIMFNKTSKGNTFFKQNSSHLFMFSQKFHLQSSHLSSGGFLGTHLTKHFYNSNIRQLQQLHKLQQKQQKQQQQQLDELEKQRVIHARYQQLLVYNEERAYMSDNWKNFIRNLKCFGYYYGQSSNATTNKIGGALTVKSLPKGDKSSEGFSNGKVYNFSNFIAYNRLIENAKNKKISALLYSTYQQINYDEDVKKIFKEDPSLDTENFLVPSQTSFKMKNNHLNLYGINSENSKDCLSSPKMRRREPVRYELDTEMIDFKMLKEIIETKSPLAPEQSNFLESFLKITDNMNSESITDVLNFLDLQVSVQSPLTSYFRGLLLSRRRQIEIQQKLFEIQSAEKFLGPQIMNISESYQDREPFEIDQPFKDLENIDELKKMIENFSFASANTVQQKFINNSFNKCLETNNLVNKKNLPSETPNGNSSSLKYQKMLLLNTILRSDGNKSTNASIYKLYLKDLIEKLPTLNHQELGKEMQLLIDANILQPNQVQTMHDLLETTAKEWDWNALKNVNKVFERCMRLTCYTYGNFNVLKPSELRRLLDMDLNGQYLLPSEKFIMESFVDQFKSTPLEKIEDYMFLLKANGLVNKENEKLLRKYLRRRGIHLPKSDYTMCCPEAASLNGEDLSPAVLEAIKAKLYADSIVEEERKEFFPVAPLPMESDSQRARKAPLSAVASGPISQNSSSHSIPNYSSVGSQTVIPSNKKSPRSFVSPKINKKPSPRLSKIYYSTSPSPKKKQVSYLDDKQSEEYDWFSYCPKERRNSQSFHSSLIEIAFKRCEHLWYRNKILKGLSDVQKLALLKANQFFDF